MSIMIRPQTVILFANTEWYLYNFRISLARHISEKGYALQLISPPGKYGKLLCQQGLSWSPVAFEPGCKSIFKEISALIGLIALYRKVRPEVVHHFTLKCVLYGSIASIFSGTRGVVNSITGLGHLFTDRRLKSRLLRCLVSFLCRLALLPASTQVIFQNEDDRESFVSAGIVAREKTHVIRGSGVDCRQFTPAAAGKRCGTQPVSLLFASRMLKEKGIHELVEAFRILRSRGFDCELLLAGDIYPDNPSSLQQSDIEALARIPGVKYLGHVDDMPQLLGRSDVVVLPSYREGTPRILLEAGAMAIPMVATDIPGCQGVVIENENGFLVPPANIEQLVEALARLVENPQLRSRFGMRSREIILQTFDDNAVIEKTMAVYYKALGQR